MKQLDLFGYGDISLSQDDKKYSRVIHSPIYTPKDSSKGSVHECYDSQKYLRMVRIINASNISEEDKAFLLLAATRFIEFNYESIADYYAKSDKEVQGLMEKLALVIIDFDKAIENGFIVLNENMRNLYLQEVSERIDGENEQKLT